MIFKKKIISIAYATIQIGIPAFQPEYINLSVQLPFAS